MLAQGNNARIPQRERNSDEITFFIDQKMESSNISTWKRSRHSNNFPPRLTRFERRHAQNDYLGSHVSDGTFPRKHRCLWLIQTSERRHRGVSLNKGREYRMGKKLLAPLQSRSLVKIQ
jgi:hypothetical protein